MAMTARKEAALCAEMLQVASIMEFHPARPARHFSKELFRVRSYGMSGERVAYDMFCMAGNIDYTCPVANSCEINKRRRKACQACR